VQCAHTAVHIAIESADLNSFVTSHHMITSLQIHRWRVRTRWWWDDWIT